MYPVIIIEHISGSFIADQPERIHIDFIHAFCRIDYRDAFAGTDKSGTSLSAMST